MNCYNEIKFEFIENASSGLSKRQIKFIKKQIRHYVKKYPLVVLKKVCDFFSWDYTKNKLDEYTFTHNKEGKAYAEYDAWGKYNDDDKLIGLNQIRLNKVKLHDGKCVRRVNRLKKKFEKMRKSYEKQTVYRQYQKEKKDFNEFWIQFFSRSELKRLEIEKIEPSEDYFDVILIRMIEKSCAIKKLVIHEFGHAIAYRYHLEDDEVIIDLYEKTQYGFENIQEFVAECFMASELTHKIPLANKVKDRIRKVTGSDGKYIFQVKK